MTGSNEGVRTSGADTDSDAVLDALGSAGILPVPRTPDPARARELAPVAASGIAKVCSPRTRGTIVPVRR